MLGYISATALVASFLFGWFTRTCPNIMSDKKITGVGEAKMIVMLCWIVLPPIWFWLQYFGVYRYEGGHYDDLDQFKYGQDIAAKIWLAAITALTIFYFGKDIRG